MSIKMNKRDAIVRAGTAMKTETPRQWEAFTEKRTKQRKAMTASQRVARRAAKLRAANRCITCARPAKPSSRSASGFSKFCEKHLTKARETKRAELARAAAIPGVKTNAE